MAGVVGGTNEDSHAASKVDQRKLVSRIVAKPFKMQKPRKTVPPLKAGKKRVTAKR